MLTDTHVRLIITVLLSISRCLHSQRYIVFEDSQEGEKKDLQGRLVMLESHTRQLELKTKNYADHSKFYRICTCVAYIVLEKSHT